jgi:hypothetical protein
MFRASTAGRRVISLSELAREGHAARRVVLQVGDGRDILYPREPSCCRLRAVLHPRLVDSDLATRRVRVEKGQVVYVKGICEASRGVAVMFSDQGDEFVMATPHCRARDLDELLGDLGAELGPSFVLCEPVPRDAAEAGRGG